MVNGSKFILLFLFAAFIAGCDKIDAPYGEKQSQQQDTTTYFRKILIEDYTGHTCGNCPRAAETMEQLHELYGKKMVSMAVHCGTFAEPAGSHFPADYRNEISTSLDAHFGNSAAGLPNGLVNRKSYDNVTILSYPAWGSKASSELNKPVEAWLTIAPSFNVSSSLLSVTVNTKILAQIEEGLQMVVYLTEDSILGPQKDYNLPSPGIIENYYHRHMLRGSMNGTWGNALTGSVFTNGQTLSNSFSYTIPSQWNAAKVHAVAVLYRASTKEVVQVEEKSIF